MRKARFYVEVAYQQTNEILYAETCSREVNKVYLPLAGVCNYMKVRPSLEFHAPQTKVWVANKTLDSVSKSIQDHRKDSAGHKTPRLLLADD